MIEMSNVQTHMRQVQPRLSGRSMIEMLGVLAIIGVLSIAAIAGIRMAMTKHQANLIIEDVKLAGFIVKDELFNTLPSDGSEQDLTGRFTPAANHTYHTFKESDTTYAVVVDGMSERVCLELKKFKPEWLEEIRANGERNVCDTSDTNAMSFFFNESFEQDKQNECRSDLDCPTEKPYCKNFICEKCPFFENSNGHCSGCLNAINAVFATQTQCLRCPETFYSDTRCYACAYQTPVLSSFDECRRCFNRYYNQTDGKCYWCYSGTVASSDGLSCVPKETTCEAPYIMENIDGKCLTCPAGNNYSNTVSEECRLCGNKVFHSSPVYCNSCFLLASRAKTLLSECQRCSNRYWIDDGSGITGTCNLCPNNTHANQAGTGCE